MNLVEYLRLHEDKYITLHFPAKVVEGKCIDLLDDADYLSIYKVLKVDESEESTDVYVK